MPTQLAFYRHELHLFDPRGSEPDLLLVSSDSPAVSLLLLQFEPGGSGRGSILSTTYCCSLSVFVLVFSGPDRLLHIDPKGSVLEHLLSLGDTPDGSATHLQPEPGVLDRGPFLSSPSGCPLSDIVRNFSSAVTGGSSHHAVPVSMQQGETCRCHYNFCRTTVGIQPVIVPGAI